MAFTGKLLDSVKETGLGTPMVFDPPKDSFTIQGISTGNPARVVVILEGSVDGINFLPLEGNFGIVFTDQAMGSISGIPLAAIRANLTVLSGGDSPTVTVWAAVT